MVFESVLVTGYSNGEIGYVLAETFDLHGLRVFASAWMPSKVSSLENFSNVILFTIDVTSRTSIAAATKTVETETGRRLDYLVNYAEYFHVMPMLDINMTEAKRFLGQTSGVLWL